MLLVSRPRPTAGHIQKWISVERISVSLVEVSFGVPLSITWIYAYVWLIKATYHGTHNRLNINMTSQCLPSKTSRSSHKRGILSDNRISPMNNSCQRPSQRLSRKPGTSCSHVSKLWSEGLGRERSANMGPIGTGGCSFLWVLVLRQENSRQKSSFHWSWILYSSSSEFGLLMGISPLPIVPLDLNVRFEATQDLLLRKLGLFSGAVLQKERCYV